MQQNNLTQKEQAYLKDALELENLCITKYSVYSDQCSDTQLKDMMFSLLKEKRQHANIIKQQLGSSYSNHEQ